MKSVWNVGIAIGMWLSGIIISIMSILVMTPIILKIIYERNKKEKKSDC